MSGVSGEQLRAYRETAGLTQAGLGNHVGVARQTIAAWERGSSSPSLEQLYAVAKQLAVPVDVLIERPTEADPMAGGTLLFRAGRRQDLSAETLVLLRRKAADYAAVEQVLGEVPTLPESRPAGTFEPETVEQMARSVRDWLGVKDGPLGDAINLLEGKGLKVIRHPLPAMVSGCSAYSDELGAVVFVNADHPVERQYFTALHELAHLILHRREYSAPSSQPMRKDPREEGADLLAGAVLLPRATVLSELHSYRGRWLPAPLLLDIKLRYSVSMRTVLYRACQTGLISQSQMGKQMGALNKQYGHDSEPGQVLRAQGMPRLMRLTYAALLAEKITPSRVAEVLMVPLLSVQDSLAEWTRGGPE